MCEEPEGAWAGPEMVRAPPPRSREKGTRSQPPPMCGCFSALLLGDGSSAPPAPIPTTSHRCLLTLLGSNIGLYVSWTSARRVVVRQGRWGNRAGTPFARVQETNKYHDLGKI